MITISQTSHVKMDWSINRNISKFNSGLCYWRLSHFILSSSETFGWFFLLVITICSLRKQPMFCCEHLAQLHPNPFCLKPIPCLLLIVIFYCRLQLFKNVSFSPSPVHFQYRLAERSIKYKVEKSTNIRIFIRWSINMNKKLLYVFIESFTIVLCVVIFSYQLLFRSANNSYICAPDIVQ